MFQAISRQCSLPFAFNFFTTVAGGIVGQIKPEKASREIIMSRKAYSKYGETN